MTKPSLEIRPFIFGEDYPEACEWWRARGWLAPSKSKLPPFGYLATSGETKLAAAWLYFTGSGWAFLDYTVTNPRAPAVTRGRGAKLVIEKICEFAKAENAEDVVTFTASKGLIRLLTKCGFHVGDKGLTSLIRRVA